MTFNEALRAAANLVLVSQQVDVSPLWLVVRDKHLRMLEPELVGGTDQKVFRLGHAELTGGLTSSQWASVEYKLRDLIKHKIL